MNIYIKMMVHKDKPSSNGSGQNGNKGFANTIMLSLIVSFVCGALFMVVYMIIGR